MDRDQTLSWLETAVAGINGLNNYDLELFLLPSAPLIGDSVEKTSGSILSIGVQNISVHDSGSFTGEISPHLVEKMGCKYALVGHHERRTIFSEDDDVIAQKIVACARNGLVPILCVGELNMEEGSAQAEVKAQLRSALNGLKNLRRIVIAYEPTWAIGAETPASPEQINKMCSLIRAELEDMNIKTYQILYGGSAGAGLYEMISQTCDGLFLGRRVHDPRTYLEIIQECISVKSSQH